MPRSESAYVDRFGCVRLFRPRRLRFHDLLECEIVDRAVTDPYALRLIGIVVRNFKLHHGEIEEERLIGNIVVAVGKIHILQISVRREHGIRAVRVDVVRHHMRIGFMRIEIGLLRPNVNVVFAAARRGRFRTVDSTPPMNFPPRSTFTDLSANSSAFLTYQYTLLRTAE